MNEVQLPFGLRDGRMAAVEQVKRGLACGCVCPECGAALVACKGEIVRHHFRHHIETAACRTARETALHRYAKQIICDEMQLLLPDYFDPRWSHLYFEHKLGSMRSARQEVWLDGVQPDVLAEYGSESVAIEIYVAHRVPREKIAKLAARGLATVEIDLSAHHRADLSTTEWRDLVLSGARREWLHPPGSVRDAVTQEERRQLEKERARAEEFRWRKEQERQQQERDRLALEKSQHLAREKAREVRERWEREEAERWRKREAARLANEELQAKLDKLAHAEAWQQTLKAARETTRDLDAIIGET